MYGARRGFGLAFFALACAVRAQEPLPGQQLPGKFSTEVVQRIEIGYLLFLPESYTTKDSWPLLVFLHGSGERGSDPSAVKKSGPPLIVERQKNFPFIVLSPQCPANRTFDVEALAKLTDEITSKFKVDRERVYLTGLSMGGCATFALAAAHPDKFAAIAPICGCGDTKTADQLKSLPAWVFHGAKDPAEPVRSSQEMVDAIKAAGGDVRFTIYPEGRHDVWTQTYANPELFEWFLAHRRSPSKKP